MSTHSPESEDEVGKGRFAAFLKRLVGPGNLGLHGGLVTGMAMWLLCSWFSGVEWDRDLPFRVIVGLVSSYFGGGVGGLTGRDALLRTDWVRYRSLVGLIAGLVIGSLGGLLMWDIWVGLVGAIGGGLGGLIDSLVHRKTLEDDW